LLNDQSLRDQFIDVANRKDTNGLPCSTAWAARCSPSGPLAPPPDYSFEGLPGQSAADTVSIPLTLDGDAAFMFRPSAMACTTPASAPRRRIGSLAPPPSPPPTPRW
jgi:flagellar hook-associated protein 3 FlgL